MLHFLGMMIGKEALVLPHVHKLWLGVSNGTQPMKRLAPNDSHGSWLSCAQLVQRLACEAPAYLDEEGATQLRIGLDLQVG